VAALRSRFFLLFCTSFLCVVSQKRLAEPDELWRHYRQAKHQYDRATALGSSTAASLQQEEGLNNAALHSFRSLLVQIPDGSAYDSLRFHTYFIIGELEHYFERTEEALLFYRKALGLNSHPSLQDSLFFRPYLYAGIILYQQNKLDSASRYFLQAEKVQAAYHQPLNESERLFNTLGVIQYETGNYYQAKNYFSKALEVLQPSNPYYRDLLVNYKINLAQIHFKLEEFDKANSLYRELIAYGRNLPEIYHNLALIQLKLGAPMQALIYFRKVSFSPQKRVRLFGYMGNAFLQLRQWDSANAYFNKALDLWQQAPLDYVGYGVVLKGRGDLLVQQNQPAAAMKSYTKAVRFFYPAYADTSVYKNPEAFHGVFSYINLYEVLTAKAEAAEKEYRTSNNMQWAEAALSAYQSAFRLIDYVSHTYNSDEARLLVNRYKYAVHARPIDIAFELYRRTGKQKFIEDLYVLDQQNKGSVLAMNQQAALQASTTGSSQLLRSKALKTTITRLSLQAAQTTDSAKLASLNRQIRDYELELQKAGDSTNVYRKEQETIPAVAHIQQKILDPSTALISYHLSDTKLTIVFISRQKFDCFQKELPPRFHEKISESINALRNPEAKAPLAFYDLLFGSLPLSGVKRLILIPDDELNYFSFESLKLPDGSYLVQHYALQYQYTAALLQKTGEDFTRLSSIAFAPFSESAARSAEVQFERLSFSADEISVWKGKELKGTEATKQNFLHQVPSYQMVHLATHAVAGAGPGQSYIAFNGSGDGNSLLYAEEIYNLSLAHTRLVLLSACETGAGDLVRGEGVMSLSRAFSYAGCPNIITSLWKADDFSTAYLVKKIHDYLGKSYTIDKALQQAKLDYLNDPAIHPRRKHPYYWAHLVFIGEHEADEGSLPWWIAGLLIPAIALFMIGLRKKSKFKPTA
jgi:tetratricopeptide (TPR) repeat protein